MHWLRLTLAVWTALATFSWSRDIFVDNQRGDDRGEGRRPLSALAGGGPVLTIAKALRLAEPGDRIVIANTGEPYRESISLTGAKHSGSESNPFVILGNGATLDGSTAVDPRTWTISQGDVFLFTPARMGYQQLFVAGQPAARRASPPASPLPELSPLEWCLWNGGIYFRVESGRLPQDYDYACAGLAAGITLDHVRGVVIADLVIQGYQAEGVNAIDAARFVQLNGLTCRYNGRSGISIGGASTVEINGALLEGNGAGQLRSEGVSQVTLRDSKLIPDSAQAILREGGQVTIDAVR